MWVRTRDQVRIIGGQWRGRKISFPALTGLRPTHDRIRETLFNWLMNDIDGAVCLDLFAGSGALGFEALSRGAEHVTFVDNEPKVIDSIHAAAKKLQTQAYDALLANVPGKTPLQTKKKYDIVFLDPPFHQDLLQPTCQWLQQNSYLEKGAYIYVEVETGAMPASFPVGWECYRHKKTSSIEYALWQLIIGEESLVRSRLGSQST